MPSIVLPNTTKNDQSENKMSFNNLLSFSNQQPHTFLSKVFFQAQLTSNFRAKRISIKNWIFLVFMRFQKKKILYRPIWFFSLFQAPKVPYISGIDYTVYRQHFNDVFILHNKHVDWITLQFITTLKSACHPRLVGFPLSSSDILQAEAHNVATPKSSWRALEWFQLQLIMQGADDFLKGLILCVSL